MKPSEYFEAVQETIPAKLREQMLTAKLQEIVRYACAHAPAIKEKFETAGIFPSQINTIADLQIVPITRKDQFTAFQKAAPPMGGFLAESRPRIVFASPGPIYEPEDTLEQILVTAKALYAGGFRSGDTAIITFSFHLSPGGIRMAEACKRLGMTWIPTGAGNTEMQLTVMRDLKVNCYIGTPSFLSSLIKKAEEAGQDFRRDYFIRKAWFIGEMFPPSLREYFESMGIITAQGYGTGELGTLAYECSQKNGYHISDEYILEIVDPDTGKQLPAGEVGEVVVTPFNKIFPLIRYGTGDLSSLTVDECPCGRTAPRLTGICGRIGDEVKVRGMFVHCGQLQSVIAKFPQVLQYQVLIRRAGQRDEIILTLECPESTDRRLICESVSKAVQENCRVRPDKIEVVNPGTIPPDRKAVCDERVWK